MLQNDRSYHDKTFNVLLVGDGWYKFNESTRNYLKKLYCNAKYKGIH